MPRPDITCPKTQLAGALHRFARPMPEPDPLLLERFRQFSKRWIHENLTPLAADTTFDFEDWLAQTNYTEAFRSNLRDVNREMNERGGYWSSFTSRNRNKDVHMFTKDESYMEYKHARCINGRVDAAKCFMGPVFKKIEQVVFDNPHFIKKIPVRDRPAYLRKVFEGPGSAMFVDFTSLEATLRVALMEIEVYLYNYMLQNTVVAEDAAKFFEEVLMGRNIIDGKFLTLYLLARRLSGENNTSLGNGIFCLLITLFAYEEEVGTPYYYIKSVGEGDDGLWKEANGRHPTAPFYRSLGAIIKIELVEDVFSASFCGLVCDEEELLNIADPKKTLANFGLTSHTYAMSKKAVHKALLRAKALSLAYQYPNTPIFSALAKYALRVTSGHDARAAKYVIRDNLYKWAEADIAKFRLDPAGTIRRLRMELEVMGEPGPRTRQLMEKLFNVSVGEQKRIETYLDSLIELQPLIIDLDWHTDWLDFANRFRVEYKAPRVPFQPLDLRRLDLRDWCNMTGQLDFYT